MDPEQTPMEIDSMVFGSTPSDLGSSIDPVNNLGRSELGSPILSHFRHRERHESTMLAVWFLGVVLVICCMNTRPSHAAPPSIETLSPAAGQVGTSLTLRLSGTQLDTADQLLFYDPMIRCREFRAISAFEADAVIDIDPAAPQRNVPFRVVGRDGFAEIRTIRITSLPTLLEAARAGMSEPLRLEQRPVTVSGVLASGDRDRYAVSIEKGERLTVEVEAMRLGNVLLDTVLHVYDPSGKEIFRSDDTALFQQDPVVSFITNEAGVYTIEVHESNYEGSDASRYLLHVGAFPAPGVAYPAGAEAGQELQVSFLRPDGTRHEQQVMVPKDPTSFQLFVRESDDISPSAIPFRVSTMHNELEQEPNDDPARSAPQTIPIPAAFNGVLQTAGDVDHFWFQGTAQVAMQIDCFSTRIGSPADTVISLFDGDGNLLHRNDDWESLDSRIEFTPRVTGTYRLSVTDKLAMGRADAVYRLEVTSLSPQVTPFLPRPDRLTQRGQTIHVPRGNRVLARIGVRREHVAGAVELEWDQLPTGVNVTQSVLESDPFWVPVILEAPAEANEGGTLCKLFARCQSPDQGTIFGSFSQTVDLIAMSADRLFQASEVDRIAVAVTPPLPFRIDVDAPTASLPIGGTLDLRVRVTRENGFTAPVRVEFPVLPSWVVADPFVIIPGDQSEARQRLTAHAEAQPSEWQFAATARVDTVSAREDTQLWDGREIASNLVPVRIAAAEVRGQIEPLAAEQGQTVEVRCRLSFNEKQTDQASLESSAGRIPSQLIASLEGLPNRVVADTQTITAASREVVFQVAFPNDAPLGTFKRLQVRLTGELQGQRISYVVAPDTSLTVLPPGKLFRDERGQLLSPLDALRRTKLQRIKSQP
jgi:hypothetical protein